MIDMSNTKMSKKNIHTKHTQTHVDKSQQQNK